MGNAVNEDVGETLQSLIDFVGADAPYQTLLRVASLRSELLQRRWRLSYAFRLSSDPTNMTVFVP